MSKGPKNKLKKLANNGRPQDANRNTDENFEQLEFAFMNTLSLDGSTPNAMQADLDMNGQDVINVGTVNAQDFRINGDSIAADTVATQAADQAGQARDEIVALINQTLLGAKNGDPVVDNSGMPLVEGVIYYNRLEEEMRVWSGIAWDVLEPLPQGLTDPFDGEMLYYENGSYQPIESGENGQVLTWLGGRPRWRNP